MMCIEAYVLDDLEVVFCDKMFGWCECKWFVKTTILKIGDNSDIVHTVCQTLKSW